MVRASNREGFPIPVRASGLASAVAVCVLLVLSTNSLAFEIDLLNPIAGVDDAVKETDVALDERVVQETGDGFGVILPTPLPPAVAGPDHRGIEYRAVADFMMRHWRPGDVVLSQMPHVLEYYTGIEVDYYLQSLLGRQVILNTREETAVYMDKFRGRPVLRSLREVRQILAENPRVWILESPRSAFESSNETELIRYLLERTTVELEAANVRVLLWER